MNEADRQTPTLAMNKNVISGEGEEEQEEGVEDEAEEHAIERWSNGDGGGRKILDSWAI